jgi:hypothetical protein
VDPLRTYQDTFCTVSSSGNRYAVADSRPNEVNFFFPPSIYLILPAALGPGFTQPLTEMTTRTLWPESASELYRPSDRLVGEVSSNFCG